MRKTNGRNGRGLRRALLAAALLLAGTLPAMGQAVIMSGNYYLTHNEAGTTVNATATTTFNPATCLWDYARRDYIRTANSDGEAFGGNNYLQYTSLSLGADWGTWYRGDNEENIYHRTGNQGNRRYHYPRLSGTTWSIAYNQTSENSSTSLYDVTIAPVQASSTNPTISGSDIITATGSTGYTASGAAYQTGYTNYRFNSTNHYFDADGNSITTPAAATIGSATWSLTANAYATVNTSNGTVTVSSLPESDLQLTLTVTYPVTGGTPATPAGTTLTASKEITIQGTKPSAPIISVSGNSATLSTDAAGATTIRYTLDGSNPTASTGTVYSGAIDLSGSTSSPITIKAVTVRNGNASDITEQAVTLTLPEPTITINGEAQTAAISSSVAGTTIYYTTDGSTPTTSSSQYTGTLTGLAIMTTIKAIAIKDGWNNSPVATDIMVIPSGVSGGVVTLFDYEPHEWAYYNKELGSPIRSWNPANVKITYYGNGTGTVQTNNNDTPSTWGANATTVKVGIDADANTFVYYKTLERTDGRTADNPSGRCAYTTIANPFAVRPTYDSDGTSKYRGFYAWRVKTLSGGTIHSADTGGTNYTVGSTINAETEIYFAPSSEYGMAVEFEALWARAYVSTSGVPSNYLGVERNFYVITTSANSDITAGGYPCTYTSLYPNGTTDETNAASSVSVYKYGGFTAAADSKIENIILRNNNSTINAAGHNFTIGRGVSGYNNGACATILQATSDMDEDFKFRIESGQYTYLTYTGGYTYGSSQYQSGGNSSNAYTLFIKSALGCDYDRARGSAGNEHLNITGNVIMGYATTLSSNNNRTRKTLDVTVKSGRFLTSMGDNMGNADAHQSMYMSIAGTQTNVGERSLTIEGGEIANIAGGIDGLNNYNYTYSTGGFNPHTAAYTEAATNWTNNGYRSFNLRMKGGTVKGAIYCGAAKSPASGDRWMVFTGGTVGGWIGSGCNGTANEGGQTYGESFVYVGGNTHVGGYTANINGGEPGCVFGAGKGYADPNGTSGVMTYGTNLAIADSCVIEKDVFGGGNYGYAEINTNLYIIGGDIKGNAFGGSNLKQGPVVNVIMKGGLVEKNLYGGSNASGTVTGPVSVTVSGGTVGTAGINPATSETGHVFGSGYGAGTSVTGNVQVIIGDASGSHKDFPLIHGNVYGGGFAAPYTSNGKTFRVTGQNGLVKGSIFGGGKGNTAVVTGPTDVLIKGNIEVEGNVFGGGDAAAVEGDTSVKLQD